MNHRNQHFILTVFNLISKRLRKKIQSKFLRSFAFKCFKILAFTVLHLSYNPLLPNF